MQLQSCVPSLNFTVAAENKNKKSKNISFVNYFILCLLTFVTSFLSQISEFVLLITDHVYYYLPIVKIRNVFSTLSILVKIHFSVSPALLAPSVSLKRFVNYLYYSNIYPNRHMYMCLSSLTLYYSFRLGYPCYVFFIMGIFIFFQIHYFDNEHDVFSEMWNNLPPRLKRTYARSLLKIGLISHYKSNEIPSFRTETNSVWKSTDNPDLDLLLSRLTKKQYTTLKSAFVTRNRGLFKMTILDSLKTHGDRRHYLVKQLWDFWLFKDVQVKYSTETFSAFEVTSNPISIMACGIVSMYTHYSHGDRMSMLCAANNLYYAMLAAGIEKHLISDLGALHAMSRDTLSTEGPEETSPSESMISKLIAILGLISSLSVVNSLGITQSEGLSHMTNILKEVSAVATLQDKIFSFIKLVELRYKIASETGWWEGLFGPTLHDWRKKVQKIQNSNTNKTLLNIAKDSVVDELENLIKQGESYSKNHYQFSVIDGIQLKSLLKIKMDLYAYWQALKPRKKPFSFVFIGDPGVGKSSLVYAAKELLADAQLREPTDQDVFLVPLADKHWNNCRNPKIVLFDDVRGQGHDRLAEQCFPELLTGLINEQPFPTPQAAIEDKVANCIAPDGVVISTNDYFWNFSELGTNWEKLLRRLPFVVSITDPNKKGNLEKNPSNILHYEFKMCQIEHSAGTLRFIPDKDPIPYNQIFIKMKEIIDQHETMSMPKVTCAECPFKRTAVAHNHDFLEDGTAIHPGFCCTIDCPIRRAQFVSNQEGRPNYPIIGIDLFPNNFSGSALAYEYFQFLRKSNLLGDFISSIDAFKDPNVLILRTPRYDININPFKLYFMACCVNKGNAPRDVIETAHDNFLSTTFDMTNSELITFLEKDMKGILDRVFTIRFLRPKIDPIEFDVCDFNFDDLINYCTEAVPNEIPVDDYILEFQSFDPDDFSQDGGDEMSDSDHPESVSQLGDDVIWPFSFSPDSLTPEELETVLDLIARYNNAVATANTISFLPDLPPAEITDLPQTTNFLALPGPYDGENFEDSDDVTDLFELHDGVIKISSESFSPDFLKDEEPVLQPLPLTISPEKNIFQRFFHWVRSIFYRDVYRTETFALAFNSYDYWNFIWYMPMLTVMAVFCIFLHDLLRLLVRCVLGFVKGSIVAYFVVHIFNICPPLLSWIRFAPFKERVAATYSSFATDVMTVQLKRRIVQILAVLAAILLALGFWAYSRSDKENTSVQYVQQADRIPLHTIGLNHPITKNYGFKGNIPVGVKPPFYMNDAPQVEALPAHHYNDLNVEELCESNHRQVWFTNNTHTSYLGLGLAIDSNHTIMPYHVWKKMHNRFGSCTLIASNEIPADVNTTTMPNGHRTYTNPASAFVDKDKDLALVWHSTMPASDISKRFVSIKNIKYGDYCAKFLDVEGVSKVYKTSRDVLQSGTEGTYCLFENVVSEYPKSAFGSCGRPTYLCKTGNNYDTTIIFGIHVAGNLEKKMGISSFVSSDWIAFAKKAIPSHFKLDVDPLECAMPVLYKTEGLPVRVQLFSDIGLSVPASFLGTVGPLRNKSKSQVKLTEFHSVFAHRMETQLVIPDLGNRGFLKDDQWTSPCTHYIKMFETHPTHINFVVLNKSIQDYLSDLPPGSAQPLSFAEAVSGVEGHPLIKKMNLSTSIGSWREYYKDKKEVLSLEHADSDLVAEVYAYLEKRAQGFMICNYQEVNWKDEPIKKTKNDVLKFRPFAVFEKNRLITTRMLLLPIIAYLYEHKQHFECYGAFNPASPQFEELLKTMVSENYHLGDISHMDASARAFIADSIAIIFREVSQHLGYSKEDSRLAEILVRELIFSIVSLNRDIYWFNEKLGSGDLITFIWNCLSLSIIFRYAWFIHRGLDAPSFRSQNTLAAGGDDSAHTSKDPSFDFFAIQAGCRALGYVYTSARKDGREEAHSPLAEFVFLKRTPVEILVGTETKIVGQLALDSIYKNLCFILPSKSVTYPEQMKSKCDAAVREAALHPKHVFDEIVSEVLRFYPDLKVYSQEEYWAMYLKGNLYESVAFDQDLHEFVEFSTQSHPCDMSTREPPGDTPYSYSLALILMFSLFEKLDARGKILRHFKADKFVRICLDLWWAIPLIGLASRPETLLLLWIMPHLWVSLGIPLFVAINVYQEEILCDTKLKKFVFSLYEYTLYCFMEPDLWFMRLMPLTMHWINMFFFSSFWLKFSFHFLYNLYWCSHFTILLHSYKCATTGSSPVIMSDRFNALQTREFRITNSTDFIDLATSYTFGVVEREFVSNYVEPFRAMSIGSCLMFTLLTEFNITKLSLSSDLDVVNQKQQDVTYHLKPTSEMDLKKQFERPVKVGGFVWTSSSTPVTRTNLIQQYFNEPTIARLLGGYAYFKGKPKLTFVVNGFSMWFGKAVIAPFYNSFGRTNYTPSVQLWDFPSAMNVPNVSVDPSKSTTYEMYPFWYHREGWRSIEGPATAELESDFDITLFPQFLSSVNTTAPTSVEIVMWMSFEDVELSVAYSTQSEASDMEKFSISQPLSSLASAAQPGADLIQAVTGSSAANTAVKATKRVAGAFQKLGYGSPAQDNPPHLYKPVQTANSFSNQYGDTSLRLMSGPSSSIPINSSSLGFGSDDEKMLSGIVRKWGYVQTIYWLPETPNQLIASLFVNPMCSFRYSDLSYRLTPLSTISSVHARYSGSLEVKLEICCSEYHRGSIGVSYEKRFTNLIPVERKPTVFQSVIADIKETKEITMILPCLDNEPIQTLARVTDTSLASSHGMLSVYSVTQLKTMGSNSPVFINVYIRAGDDFKLYNPETTDGKFVTESAPTDMNGFAEINDKHLSLMLVGEASNSLMGVIGKPAVCKELTPPTISTGVFRYNRIYFPTRPLTTTAGGQFAETPLAFLCQCFLGMKGSLRYKLYNMGGCRPWYAQFESGRADPFSYSTFTTFLTYDSGWGRSYFSTATAIGSDIAEIEFPMVDNFQFIDPRLRYNATNQITTEAQAYMMVPASTNQSFAVVMESAGDDLSLHGFYHTPRVYPIS